MEERINNIAINTIVRPPKVVVLLDTRNKDWMISCISIISMFSKMWGGEYNLIIPTNGKTIDDDFIKILKVYDADYIYYYKSTIRELKYFDRNKFDELVSDEDIKMKKEGYLRTKKEWEDDNSFLNYSISIYAIEDELEEVLDRYTNPFRIGIRGKILGTLEHREKASHPLTNIVDILEEDKSLALEFFNLDFDCKLTKLLIYSKIGVVDEPLFEGLKKMKFNMDISKVSSNEEVARCLTSIYNTQDTKNRVFSLSNINTTYYTNNEYDVYDSNTIIVGDTLPDFCLYYCLSRLKTNVNWIPMESKYTDDICYNLRYKINTLDYMQEDKLMILSNSLNKGKLKQHIEYIKGEKGLNIDTRNIKLEFDIELNKILSNTKTLINTDNYINNDVILFSNGKSITPIDAPIPKKFKHIHPCNHKWITEVIFNKYLIPQRSYLIDKILIENRYSERDIRVTKDGISYFSPHHSYFSSWGTEVNNFKIKPYLVILKPYDIFKEIFLQAEKDITYSDKGLYADEFIRKIGTLEYVENLLTDEDYNKLFNKYKDTSNSKSGVYNNGIYLNKRRYLDLESINTLICDELKVSNILGELIEKGIILRGFIFKCKYCRNADWYSIKDVNDDFKCTRCSISQKYSEENLRLQPIALRNEPLWYYKLEELSYQAWINNTIVPLLTLTVLRKAAKKSFEYISEIEIREIDSSGKPNMEVDICCIIDGLITIGECKISDKLKEGKQSDEMVIDKYHRLAERINADLLVFSSYKGWREITRDKIIELQKRVKSYKVIIIENEILMGLEELEI